MLISRSQYQSNWLQDGFDGTFWRYCASFEALREEEAGAQQDAVEFLSKQWGPNHMEAYLLLQVSPKKVKIK